MGERVLKLEASAGSGKTYRLTLEYLIRLFRLFAGLKRQKGSRAEAPRILASVLAITFTNKAAGEMKERILGRLKVFALHRKGHPLPEGDARFLTELAQQCSLEPDLILQLSEFVLDAIIVNYNDFSVKTIDSLMSAVVKVISPDLDLPPDFEVQVDAGRDLRQNALLYLEELCDHDWGQVEEFLKDLQDIEPLKNWRVEQEMIGLLVYLHRLSMNRDFDDIDVPVLRHVQEEVAKAAALTKTALANWVALARSEPAKKGINSHINGTRVKDSTVQAMEKFIASAQLLSGLPAVIDKAVFKQEEADVLLKKGAPDEFRLRFGELFRAAKKHLSGLVFLTAEYRVLNVSRFYSGFVNFRKRERKTVFVEEFSRTIRSRFEEWQQSALPYIYLKLSDRFRHFLFDEFQDTSELQFKALTPLIDEALPSDEESALFIVGDRKQAIYRWRGGNSELMDEQRLRSEIPSLELVNPNPFTHTLDKNWRSLDVIIDFNNNFWDPEALAATLPSESMLKPVRENFENFFQESTGAGTPQRGYVNITVRAKDDGDQDDEDSLTVKETLHGEILGMVNTARDKGYEGSDIAVLVRKNSDGRGVIKYLAEHGIPAISDESLFLDSSPLVNEIVSFLRFLDFPPDNLNFYTFITGSIFGKAAEERFGEEWAAFQETMLVCVGKKELFYKRFQRPCPNLWRELVEPFFKAVGFLAVYDLYQDILQVFRALRHFADSTLFFLSFGNLLHQLEQKEVSSISLFIDEWERMKRGEGGRYAVDMPEENERIRVMTLHKAKGLEFPVVILPLSETSSPVERPMFLENGRLFHITKHDAALNKQLRKIYLDEVQKAALDVLNLYYVGFTRAKEALLIPVVLKKPPAKSKKDDPFKKLGNFAHVVLRHPAVKIVNDDEDDNTGEGDTGVEEIREFGTFSPKEEKEAAAAEPPLLDVAPKKVLTSHWQRDFLVFSGTPEEKVPQSEAIERGELFHRVMARIRDFEDRSRVQGEVERIVKQVGAPPYMTRWITKFICHDTVFPFFNGGYRVLNEQEVVSVAGDDPVLRRIDRMLVGEDEVLVVEYKTGSDKLPQYREQVLEYVDIVTSIYEGKAVRPFLAYPDLLEVEEVQ